MPAGGESGRTLAPQLRRRFAARLPQQIEDMESALAAICTDPGDKQALNSLHLVVHKIAGSAAFFGFGDLSSAAFEIEQRLFAFLDGDAAGPTRDYLEKEIRPHYGSLKRLMEASVDASA